MIEILTTGEEVEILGEEGDWYKVKYLNKTGYIRKDMLDVDDNTKKESTENSIQSSNESISETSTTKENVVNTQNNTATNSNNENTVNEDIADNNNESNVNETVANNDDNKQDVTTDSTIKKENINMLQVGYTGKLSSSLKVRILPTINSCVIATVNENTDFVLTDIINKWAYIETNKTSGWVLVSKVNYTKEEVTSTEENNSSEENAKQEENKEETKEEEKKEEKKENETKAEKNIPKYVSAEILNLRKEPENNGEVITGLKINTQVTVIEETNKTWSKVTVDGKTGYVANKYLSDTKIDISTRSENVDRTDNNDTADNETKQKEEKTNKEEVVEEDNSSKAETSKSSSSGTGSEIVAFAKQYLGYKYVSGGTSPSTGFDCSGFTTYVFKHFGISLSRTSTAQASNGYAVSKSDLQPGDILIFRNSSNTAVGHVGIYVGGDSFIHAANPSKGVIMGELSSSYYSARYVGARRVI